MANLLEIENLTVELMSHRGIVYALSWDTDFTFSFLRTGQLHFGTEETG